ncbi:hypothetical protein Xant_17130 [Xanthomonas cissicola]|uniref:Uncharacterized protein n=1 Tax=Xanthomonas cissicola TaxID=86186 RepID=A0ABX3M7G3_9XANT|nr:hypothetical protein Xant_17130 [Xanthomonas cissicola]
MAGHVVTNSVQHSVRRKCRVREITSGDIQCDTERLESKLFIEAGRSSRSAVDVLPLLRYGVGERLQGELCPVLYVIQPKDARNLLAYVD